MIFAVFATVTRSKCADKMVRGQSHLAAVSDEENVVMAWRSSMGDSCLDYEKLLYCNSDGSPGLHW